MLLWIYSHGEFIADLFLFKGGGIIMDLHNFKFSIILRGQGSQLFFIRDHSKAADETLITNTAIRITSS